MASVKVFTTPTCPWCHKVKEFFKENKVKYTEVDVSKDRKAAQEMIDASGEMGVPQIWVGTGDKKKIIIGFDEAALRKELKL